MDRSNPKRYPLPIGIRQWEDMRAVVELDTSARIPHHSRVVLTSLIAPRLLDESFAVKTWAPSELEFRFAII